MFSLYFSLNVGKLLILYNIAIVYSFMSFLVAYRVYKWWKAAQWGREGRQHAMLCGKRRAGGPHHGVRQPAAKEQQERPAKAKGLHAQLLDLSPGRVLVAVEVKSP